MYLLVLEHHSMIDAEGFDDVRSSLPARAEYINQISVFCEDISHCLHVMVVPCFLKCNHGHTNRRFIRSVRRRGIPVQYEEQSSSPTPDETTS